MSFLDKAKDFAQEHVAQVEQGIEKVGDLIDEKTGGKHAGQVDQAQEKAKDFLAKKDNPA